MPYLRGMVALMFLNIGCQHHEHCLNLIILFDHICGTFLPCSCNKKGDSKNIFRMFP